MSKEPQRRSRDDEPEQAKPLNSATVNIIPASEASDGQMNPAHFPMSSYVETTHSFFKDYAADPKGRVLKGPCRYCGEVDANDVVMDRFCKQNKRFVLLDGKITRKTDADKK